MPSVGTPRHCISKAGSSDLDGLATSFAAVLGRFRNCRRSDYKTTARAVYSGRRAQSLTPAAGARCRSIWAAFRSWRDRVAGDFAGWPEVDAESACGDRCHHRTDAVPELSRSAPAIARPIDRRGSRRSPRVPWRDLAILERAPRAYMLEWRNWQTHGTQNPAAFTGHEGSTPSSSTIIANELFAYRLHR